MAKKPRPAAFIKDPLWYKDAVIYQVHVKSYYDANNDGIGDFAGLIDKLDYIADLGVNTIWLLPFYPSPRRDDGYDIAEYRGIHPDYGDMNDARRFIAEAHKRGLRIITELVINHTSDQHPWFQRARTAKKGSKARDYYVWSDTDQTYQGTRIIFLDTEKSNWTWDPVAGQYFWHRFYSHQPDLNFDNPQVLKEVLSVMRFWLDMGVDGLRLDAIPYLIERDGTNNENLPETHVVLKKIRAELDATYPDRMLLAEANQWPEDTQLYFGGENGGLGDECHMAFHFPLMPRMYMAIAQEDRFPITDILRQTPDIPENCQWAIFLRNHDELTLEMVTDDERDYLWDYYAADRRARINLGIRRRLAPLVERDRRRIELLNSLLLSMPGTPTLYYGDEIGMGDNIYLGDRDGVRTPMQWSVDRNGGFSRADPASLVLPPIMDPLYGYASINVETQSRDPHSLLNWTRRMLTVRKQQKAFGRGTLKMLAPSNRRILAYLREFTGVDGKHELILCVANMSRAAQAVELELSAHAGRVPVEMVGGSSFPPIGELNYLLTLPPYGFYWFLLADKAQMPHWHVEPVAQMPELTTLVIKRDLQELLQAPLRKVVERDVLPAYLANRRWFSQDSTQASEPSLLYCLPFGETDAQQVLCEVQVKGADGLDSYQLPLGYVDERGTGSHTPQQLALSRLRRGRQVGLMTDAFSLPSFSQAVLAQLRRQTVLTGQGSEVQFLGTEHLMTVEERSDEEVRLLSAEQSNSSAVIGERMVLKLIRRVMPGIHPEAEIGGHLTRQGFANIAPMLGEVRRVDSAGQSHTLMILQGYVSNQGDAWQWTQDTLERAVRDRLAAGQTALEMPYDALADLETFARVLGQRVGELHLALGQASDDGDFGYVESAAEQAEHWAQSIGREVEQALHALEGSQARLNATDRALATRLLGQRAELLKRVAQLAKRATGGILMRVHGDLHLGQVLVAQGDAYLIDFEGEPSRSLAERRAKHSPLKDVAGVLRSFDYAAAMALRNAQGNDLSGEAEAARQEIAGRYRLQAREAFVQAYRLAAADLPHAWQQGDGESAALALFSLEKAAYEVQYEARYRPDWLGVPVQGLSELTDHLMGSKRND
ncbi:maltose alpha-D-glucosyltransferase/ alpha-amylase [Pseudomonas cuatrocienegasensis]|uniref:maltose alpha-D-glucosyltransferase n=1 Tax=Pseudomonas cuatrocienegasensis TaxID=543360 RepID=A0ABY1BFN2_9PSED|nr:MULTISPECIES: maltose alpha-D-glucosyltransferase [Pseudomonas]OEC35919.1 trehalose synthase [Pseudomonas sp. 21C1]SEQ74555.1 maltose alpha-D-glucosyltransferase/ alpha-amylase [Pseudomonas cuatrocienegasensis]